MTKASRVARRRIQDKVFSQTKMNKDNITETLKAQIDENLESRLESARERVHFLLYGGDRENDPQYTEWRSDLESAILELIEAHRFEARGEAFDESMKKFDKKNIDWCKVGLEAGREGVVDMIEEELELSCVDDRLLGRTDEYLQGYNTSTERWRAKRDDLLAQLKKI